ncbi:RNA polymerase III subunit RPC82 helix-turn-helix domain [Musa troglodytarum]|uniref:DNA-directed RNA polymerase III subunit RPC3 n=1 Tax=Musa troglodytarum TaxID=320322 RepID=A0A9E7KB28_9LILI|nr:RNA polymerase III subunit RPC82 helix-turn-helix domain [Musa troglodytarum]
MVSQDALNLAVSLMTSHFGDLVAKVCGCLLRGGTLSLQEIVRCTELSNSQVKNGLLVLIQHNCVQAFSVPKQVGAGGATKSLTQYMALFDNILHRMRFTKFLAIVRDDLGLQSKEETHSLEQQAMIAAALSHAERFSVITDSGCESSDVKDADKQDVSVGDKRKFEVLELDEEVQAAITENEVLWRANFQKFVHCLEKKACVANVRSRLGLDAGVVLEALIESSDQEKDNSVKASMDGILEAVRGKPGGISMTLEHIRIVLDQLGCSSSIEDNNVFYKMDVQRIIESCQNDEVESLVLSRYGKEAYRIFRLLIKKGSLVETEQISDITFVEKKVAQGILYKLWNDDYLYMQVK